MSERIRGEDIELIILKDSAVVDAIQTVKSFEFTYQQELKQEGYLGETTDRYDSVFKGIKGQLELHTSDRTVFQFVQSLIDKSRRRTPGTRFNIKASFNYPNGDRARVTIIDAEFGDVPFNAANRAEYVTVRLDFGASEARVVL